MKLNQWDSHINPLPPIARASNKSCEIYGKNHQAYKNAAEVKQKLYKRWVCKGKQGCILALAPPLTPRPVATTASFASSCQ